MTSILGRIFGNVAEPPPLPGPGEIAFQEVMSESRQLRAKMREASESTDAARALMADIWAQNRNMPFLVTVYESVQEAKTGPDTMQGSQQNDRFSRSR